MCLILFPLLLFYELAVAQNASERYDLPTILKTQRQLTNFTKILSLFPDLYDRATAGNITMLAPTDDAFKEYLSIFGNFTNTTTLRAGLSYHMIEGRYTPVDFERGVQFLPTLLNDPAHSNVTGGQRVGVYPTDQGIFFEAGDKSRSNLTTSNIIYSAPSYGLGMIHIIDKVLKFPVDAFTTLADTGLQGVVDLSVKLPVNPSLEGAFGPTPDWTMFLPNSSVVDISSWPKDVVFNIQEYHFVPGHVWYSPNLTNGTQMKSFLGPNLTITVAPNGTKYLNDAKIVYSDFLINTGVLHVLERGLSPDRIDARPNFSTDSNSTVNPSPIASSAASGSSSPLTTAAKAGIGVGVSVIALAVVGALLFFFLRRRRRHMQAPGSPNTPPDVPELKDNPISEMQHPEKSYTFEADSKGIRARELQGRELKTAKPTVFHEMQ